MWPSTNQLNKISDTLLDEQDSLRVQCGDNVEFFCIGYVTLSLQIGTNPEMQLDVPFLVISEQLPHEIIKFNLVNGYCR